MYFFLFKWERTLICALVNSIFEILAAAAVSLQQLQKVFALRFSPENPNFSFFLTAFGLLKYLVF